MRYLIAPLLVLGLAAPAFAQDADAIRRMEESVRVLQQHEEQSRLQVLDNRVYELERRQREADIQRRLDEQDARAPVIPNPVLQPLYTTRVVTPQELAAAEAQHQAMLAESAARLEAIAKETNH